MPKQIKVGASGGVQAATHAVRRYLGALASHKSVAKLDFSNAFNTIDRQVIFKEVADVISDLVPYVLSSYSINSLLLFLIRGDHNFFTGCAAGGPSGTPTLLPLSSTIARDSLIRTYMWLFR